MLKRANRITSNFEFNVTRKYGNHYTGDMFHMYVLKPKNYTGPMKVGIVVSSKLDKRAVGRNRLKRLYNEAVKDSWEKINKDNTWVVIHPTHKSLEKSYEEISTDFNKTIQKISFTN